MNASVLDDKLSIRESSNVVFFLSACFDFAAVNTVFCLLFEFYHCFCHQLCNTEKKMLEWAYNHKYFNLLNK